MSATIYAFVDVMDATLEEATNALTCGEASFYPTLDSCVNENDEDGTIIVLTITDRGSIETNPRFVSFTPKVNKKQTKKKSK